MYPGEVTRTSFFQIMQIKISRVQVVGKKKSEIFILFKFKKGAHS
jgi:hypothetical protein